MTHQKMIRRRIICQAKWSAYHAALGFVMAVLAFVIMAIVGPSIGKLEGKLWPVTSLLVITSAVNAPPPNSRYAYAGHAYKYRGRCSLLGTRWFLRDNGVMEMVRAYSEDTPKIRLEGFNTYEALVVYAAPATLAKYGYAENVYQCPWLPWQTISEFYNANP